MDDILVITLNVNEEQVETRLTVDELIYAWYHDIDIPTNDDVIVSCVLGHTKVYAKTFGELMMFLNCGEKLIPCSLCDTDIVNCSNSEKCIEKIKKVLMHYENL